VHTNEIIKQDWLLYEKNEIEEGRCKLDNKMYNKLEFVDCYKYYRLRDNVPEYYQNSLNTDLTINQLVDKLKSIHKQDINKVILSVLISTLSLYNPDFAKLSLQQLYEVFPKVLDIKINENLV
jgi:hypothetical protein